MNKACLTCFAVSAVLPFVSRSLPVPFGMPVFLGLLLGEPPLNEQRELSPAFSMTDETSCRFYAFIILWWRRRLAYAKSRNAKKSLQLYYRLFKYAL